MGDLPLTEQFLPEQPPLDRLPTLALLRLMNREDQKVVQAVEEALPAIAATVEVVADRLARGGRLFFVGAGTSGRLGAAEAAECPPTFGTPPEMVQALIAGGERALRQPVEGAEDDTAQAQTAVQAAGIGPDDVVVGITASGRTPFVRAALETARARGAWTVALVCTPDAPLAALAHQTITVAVGPEVLAGSTRLKAGTAQKMVLNMLTTAAMARLGRVYGPFMVDLQPTNQKLRTRAQRIVCLLTGASPEAARAALEAAGWRVKLAIVMLRASVDAATAAAALDQAGGHVRRALARLGVEAEGDG